MNALQFALNQALDREALSRSFQEEKRLHIPDFLAPECAEQLLAFLTRSEDWTLVMNQGDKLLELDRWIRADISAAKQVQIDEAIYAAARQGFQFRYENIRVKAEGDDGTSLTTPLVAFAQFLNSDEALSFFRDVTGFDDISFADTRATAYGPGHFLTSHDDDAHGQSRRIAYVYNLTKQWNHDWGGLLTFPETASSRATAFVPAFNATNLFAVPRQHSVSFVTPFANARRYSVTGWLHAGPRP